MNPCSNHFPALAGKGKYSEVAGGCLIYGAAGFFWRRSTKNFAFLAFLISLLVSGCSDGDVKKASGNYEVTVVAPNGHSDIGSGTVSNSGDFFSIVINSSVGNFAVAGTLNNNVIETEFTDSAGGAATAKFQFSVDRSTFTGTIQTTTGLFVFRGTKLSPLT